MLEYKEKLMTCKKEQNVFKSMVNTNTMILYMDKGNIEIIWQSLKSTLRTFIIRLLDCPPRRFWAVGVRYWLGPENRWRSAHSSGFVVHIWHGQLTDREQQSAYTALSKQ